MLKPSKENTDETFLAAMTLACVFSVSALAGDILLAASPAPPPSGMMETTNPISPGEMSSGGSAEEMSDAALSALLTVLGFLTA